MPEMNWSNNPLVQLRDYGESVWVESLQRPLLQGGTLNRLVQDDGIAGATALAAPSTAAALNAPSVADLRTAAWLLRRQHRNSNGRDGIVSIDLAPGADAAKLLAQVDCPNVIVGLPATAEALDQGRALIAAGIGVDFNLIFSVGRCREALAACLDGLDARRRAGQRLEGIATLASVCVNCIDAAVDVELRAVEPEGRRRQARALIGQAGVLVARSAYQVLKKFLASSQWQALAAHGALPPRIRWTGLDTLDPAAPDFKYVTELVGRGCIAAMSMKQIDAYRRFGKPYPRIEADPYRTAVFPNEWLALGIDVERIGHRLQLDRLGEKASGSVAPDRTPAPA